MKTSLTQTRSGPFVTARPALSRRKFLRSAGILLSLPLLDAMTPAFAAAAKRIAACATPGGKPRRMFAICNNLGLLPEHFFPKESGRDYPLSPYLEVLKEHRRPIRAAAASATPFRSTNTSASASGTSPGSRRSRWASMCNRVCAACRGRVQAC